ncbi:putative uncharacterized protein [Parachlamydia acanthamoebae UV-7]|uniref:Uncharacterized protein n=2 Tax=Parachlamydia acanthamoebae TaxID=83552 RepID=F8L1E6_PARAV|nr:putative uncharacterized protein [Parachlamydia acanthamoebae UV-7]
MKPLFNIFLSFMTACFFLANPMKIHAEEVDGDEEKTENVEETVYQEDVDPLRQPPKSNLGNYLLSAALLVAATGVGGYYLGEDNSHTKKKVIKPDCPVCPECSPCPPDCVCPTCATCGCPSTSVDDTVTVTVTVSGDFITTSSLTIAFAFVSPDGSYRNDSITVSPSQTKLAQRIQGPPLTPGIWRLIITGVDGASQPVLPSIFVTVSTANSGIIAQETFGGITPGDIMTINFTISS